jgi:type II secretory pathway component PulF
MPTYQFEAMDAAGQEIRDVVEAPSQDEAQATIRQMGYFVTKISVKKARKTAAEKKAGKNKGKTFALGGVSGKNLTTFTRQLSILQDAGLPILRSLKVLEQQAKPGALKNALIDVCEGIESGDTLSEAMAKCPKAFDRLYVNMIKAGEAGGALEIILQRPGPQTQGQRRTGLPRHGRRLRRGHPHRYHDLDRARVRGNLPRLRGRPAADDHYADGDFPRRGQLLVPAAGHSHRGMVVRQAGAQVRPRPLWLGPVHIEDTHLRKDHSKPGFHPVTLFFWFMFLGGPIGMLIYMMKLNQRMIDDMVVNMVDVGEETGELDVMLYKVADTYDEEVKVLTESLMSLMEPLLIMVLGGIVGFIVVALFMPLITLITELSG